MTGSRTMTLKIRAAFLMLIFSCSATSQTIWCKALNLGCLSNAEKEKIYEKELRNCEMLANSSYREGLTEALADDTIWRFAGNTSAQDYAKMRKNLMMSICMKNPNKLAR